MSKLVVIAGRSMLPEEGPKSGMYYSSEQMTTLFGDKKPEEELVEMRKINNPENCPVGDHTGRCAFCGGTNLWSDNLAYGCDDCGAYIGTN